MLRCEEQETGEGGGGRLREKEELIDVISLLVALASDGSLLAR